MAPPGPTSPGAGPLTSHPETCHRAQGQPTEAWGRGLSFDDSTGLRQEEAFFQTMNTLSIFLKGRRPRAGKGDANPLRLTSCPKMGNRAGWWQMVLCESKLWPRGPHWGSLTGLSFNPPSTPAGRESAEHVTLGNQAQRGRDSCPRTHSLCAEGGKPGLLARQAWGPSQAASSSPGAKGNLKPPHPGNRLVAAQGPGAKCSCGPALAQVAPSRSCRPSALHVSRGWLVQMSQKVDAGSPL